jgi:hypothetical protein
VFLSCRVRVCALDFHINMFPIANALFPVGIFLLQEYMAICAAVRNSHADVTEWLDWHLALGVDRIYVFDDARLGDARCNADR